MNTPVYYLKDLTRLGEVAEKLLPNFFIPTGDLLIKIHFGEPGNQTAFFPEDVESLVKVFKTQGLALTFIDTPVAYHSPRNSVQGYEKVAKERGWEALGRVIISNQYKDVPMKSFKVEVCKELTEAKNVLVISHVKGHYCAGFGGAIKNLAMGGVSKQSKADQHGLGKPEFKSECSGCGLCVDLCPAKAMKMVDGKAKISLLECWGCSICELNCPNGCLKPQTAFFDDLLGQAAAAVLKNLPEKTYYINIIKNVTRHCDCEKDPKEIISSDIGALFSEDALAIDKASIDLINKKNGRDVFNEANHKDPCLQISYAAQYMGHKGDYELKEI